MFEHIIVVNGSYLSVVDGSILTLRRLTRHLIGCYPRVSMLCAARKESRQHLDQAVPPGVGLSTVPSLCMPFQPEYCLPIGGRGAAQRLLAEHADTLVHLAAPDTLAVSTLSAARRAGVPVVSSFHSNIVSYFKYLGLPRCFEKLGWSFFRWFYGRCDQVYVPTRSMQEELERHGVRARYRLWPRGVDAQRFTPRRRSLPWRRALGVGDDELLVMFAARLKWEKGLACLAEVIEQLHRHEPNIKTLIAGDGVARDKLRKRLPETIFTGFLEGDELAVAYASADIFLYPSCTDTFGNVTLEAMASGLPLVCARAPGSSCLVEHGVNGYLVEPESSDEFSAAVLALSGDKNHRRSMARASWRLSQSYTWDGAMQTLDRHYQEIWQGSRSPSARKDPRLVPAKVHLTH